MSVTSATAAAKVGRNDPCPCGSGRKYKQCCQAKDASIGLPAEMTQRSMPPPALRERLRALFVAAKKLRDAGRWADAISVSEEIVRLNPENPEAHHDLGMTCLQCGRTAEAAASLQRAVELRPSLERARHLVDVLQAEGPTPVALRACRKLSRTADTAVERRHYLAKALALEGKLEEAETELRRLLVLAPQRAASRVLAAELLSERGMLDEAAQHLAAVVEAVPGVFQQLTELKRITDADRPLVDRMRVVAEQPGLDAMTRICVHFGLGKAFNDFGDYAEAMRHYEEANRLRAMSARLNRGSLVAHYDSIIADFTAQALERARRSLARPACPGDEMPVLIVGMPRSGTTLVEQILSSHPAVAAGGELGFWKDRLSWQTSTIGSLEAGALSKAAEDYRVLLRKIGPRALRVTDKAPLNFELLWLPRLAFPDARIIHCRRHPIDTCLSIFFRNFMENQPFAWDRGDLVFFYRQYERLMDHWRRVLPADRFTEVDYEALIADREAETRRLVAFCGLDWDDACLAPERNTRVVKTASMWQVRQPVYRTSVERWRRYEPWLRELRELLPPAEAGG